MARFDPENAAEVLASCQAGAGRAAQSLQRAFDQTWELKPAEAIQPLDGDAIAESLAGPGLVFLFQQDSLAALLLCPQSSGIAPDWVASPEAGQQVQLGTLANELGHSLLPDDCELKCVARWVDHLAEWLPQVEVADDACQLAIQAQVGDRSGLLLLIWPARAVHLSSLPSRSSEREDPGASASGQSSADQQPPPSPSLAGAEPESVQDDFRRLPSYARSLLKIRVPIVVHLASAKHRIGDIVALGPGSIIQFKKSCEETLSLEVGGQEIAVGEAVKVGDKFGLWITSMSLPQERFYPVSAKKPEA